METMHKPTFLIMITAANNNKYYRMLPKDDGTFDVEYGRVGAVSMHLIRYRSGTRNTGKRYEKGIRIRQI